VAEEKSTREREKKIGEKTNRRVRKSEKKKNQGYQNFRENALGH